MRATEDVSCAKNNDTIDEAIENVIVGSCSEKWRDTKQQMEACKLKVKSCGTQRMKYTLRRKADGIVISGNDRNNHDDDDDDNDSNEVIDVDNVEMTGGDNDVDGGGFTNETEEVKNVAVRQSRRLQMKKRRQNWPKTDKIDNISSSIGQKKGIVLLDSGKAAANSTRNIETCDWQRPKIREIIRQVKDHNLLLHKATAQISRLIGRQIEPGTVRDYVDRMKKELKTKNVKNSAAAKRSRRIFGKRFHMNEDLEEQTAVAGSRSCTPLSDQNYVAGPSSSEYQPKYAVVSTSPVQSTSRDEASPSRVYSTREGVQQTELSSQNFVQNPSTSSSTSESNLVAAQSLNAAGTNPPPFVRLVDCNGKLTHIAIAESSGYRVFRVVEDSSSNYDLAQSGARNAADVNVSTAASSETVDPYNEYFYDNEFEYRVINPRKTVDFNAIPRPKKIEEWDEIDFKVEVVKIIGCLKTKMIDIEQAVKKIFELVDLKIATSTIKRCINFKEVYEKNVQPFDQKLAECNDSANDSKESALLNSLIRNGEGTGAGQYTRILNQRGNLTNIAIPENDGFRVYRLSKALGSREYYRCSNCDKLRKQQEDIVAVIIINNSIISGNPHPEHHSNCEIRSLSTVVAKEFDRQARREAANGELTPREAWCKGRVRALEAQGKADSVIAAGDYPEWQRVKSIYHKWSKKKFSSRLNDFTADSHRDYDEQHRYHQQQSPFLKIELDTEDKLENQEEYEWDEELSV